jgi:tetratricopeptide (TPR) repeat protein
MEIADHGGFNRLINQVVAHDFPNPWCHHLRFIVREEPQNMAGSPLVSLSSPKPLSMAFKDIPSVVIHEPDLSPQAVNNVLEKTTEDESLPIETRLNALLLLAGGDFAHSRFDQALDKYSLILKYYSAMNNLTMSAIALNGMGEVYERTGDDEKANEAFEAALVPASHGEHPPLQVFQNICQNLALLRSKAGKWDQAASYWDCVQQLTVANRDASMKIRSVDQLGYCYYKSNRLDEAEKQWTIGSKLAASFENNELQNALLQRRRALYQEIGDREKELVVAAELDALARKAATVS